MPGAFGQKLNDTGSAVAIGLPSIFLIFYFLYHQGKSKSLPGLMA